MPYNVDGFDPDPPAHNYCKHGTYVGGCGWDLMCGYCESGEEPPTQDELDRGHLAKAEREWTHLVTTLAPILERKWSRGQVVAVLGHMVYGEDTHISSWPISGRAWGAYDRQTELGRDPFALAGVDA